MPKGLFNLINIMAIAAGGALGAVLRHGLNSAVAGLTAASFPLGILVINVFGSFLMGVMTGVFAHFYEPPQAIKLFLTVGVLGGFTTFSAFTLDAVMLWERGEMLQSAAYVTGSVFLSIGALVAGLMLIRMVST